MFSKRFFHRAVRSLDCLVDLTDFLPERYICALKTFKDSQGRRSDESERWRSANSVLSSESLALYKPCGMTHCHAVTETLAKFVAGFHFQKYLFGFQSIFALEKFHISEARRICSAPITVYSPDLAPCDCPMFQERKTFSGRKLDL